VTTGNLQADGDNQFATGQMMKWFAAPIVAHSQPLSLRSSDLEVLRRSKEPGGENPDIGRGIIVGVLLSSIIWVLIGLVSWVLLSES
jgi:hypothetical protein